VAIARSPASHRSTVFGDSAQASFRWGMWSITRRDHEGLRAELSRNEIVHAAAQLERKARRFAPGTLAFLGKSAGRVEWKR